MEVPIVRARPSKIIAKADRLRPRLGWVANDQKSVVIVRGTQEEIDQAASYLRFFDIRPRKVGLQIDIESRIDKAEVSTVTTIRNNQTQTIFDEEIGVKLTLAPRLNDDNSVSLFAELSYRGRNTKYIMRMSMMGGQTTILHTDGSPAETLSTVDEPSSKKKPSLLPLVRIRVQRGPIELPDPDN
ncbi:MAG TPA: hypothetical protein VK934_09015 [Fimbriimonas sp.]|nr:hypothetical protein [Fimbriimonas sp.]